MIVLSSINLTLSREIILIIGKPTISECLKGVPGGDRLLYLQNQKKNHLNLRKACLVVGMKIRKNDTRGLIFKCNSASCYNQSYLISLGNGKN